MIASGNSIRINATSTVTVVNVAVGTNTFEFFNSNASSMCFAGVFSTYAQAAVAHHPTTGVTGSLIPMLPGWPITITGNFGIQPNPGTVYVAAITQTDPVTIYATPRVS